MMRTVQLFFVAIIALVAAYVLYRVFKFGDKVADAGKKVADTAYNLVAPSGVSPLSNPISEFFGRFTWKSKAERQVDSIYTSPYVTELQPNVPPGIFARSMPPVRNSDVNQTPQIPIASAPISGTGDPANNVAPMRYSQPIVEEFMF